MSFTPDRSTESEKRLFQEPKYTINIDSDPGSVSDFLGNVNLGSARLREMAGLGGGLEFLPLEEHQVTRGAIPSRGILDDLCYGTGTTYLTGMCLSFGGAWGLMEGFRGHSPNFKLRLNTILNAVTRRGPFVGNSCGVLAMGYNTINGIMGNARGKRDTLNEIGSGALIGALFKSTAGIRAASAASLICASAAGTWALVKRYYFKYE
ncbi:10376_t:CDS:2 [Ambispora leptoticha]|uniref:10376_t:CDS:1 n=1 Tax=Ambispora leptoticha TaxID=144679 RepID=A0A9N8VGD1_9GLOM|nr:10376_t:CDS:2 [Ambispora leptoticha]